MSFKDSLWSQLATADVYKITYLCKDGWPFIIIWLKCTKFFWGLKMVSLVQTAMKCDTSSSKAACWQNMGEQLNVAASTFKFQRVLGKLLMNLKLNK